MKTKLMTTTVAALAMAAALQTAAKAEEPIDPQPGVKESFYSLQENMGPVDRFGTVQAGSAVPLVVTIDASASFTKGKMDASNMKYDADTLVWEGYLMSKTAGQFTFTAAHSAGTDINMTYRNGKCVHIYPANQFVVDINGQTVAGNGAKSFNVQLNAGFNPVKIMAVLWTGDSTPTFTLNYKPANSTVTPRNITPATLYHDEEINDDDW